MRVFKILLICLLLLQNCTKKSYEDFIEASGIIEAKEILVASKIGGQIIAIRFEEGSSFLSGDTLVILDTSQIVLQLQQAEANEQVARAQLELLLKGARSEDINQAEAVLQKAQADYLLVKKNYERMLELRKANAIPDKTIDELETQLNASESNLKSAQENLKKIRSIFRPEEIIQARHNLERAVAARKIVEKNLSDCFITAPISGIVVAKFYEEDEIVSPFAPILKIANLDTVEMIVYIPEKDIGKIRYNQVAEVVVDAFPTKKFKGRIVFISSEAEFTPKNIQTKEERTKLVFGVKLQIKNEQNILKPGMPADVKIQLKTQ